MPTAHRRLRSCAILCVLVAAQASAGESGYDPGAARLGAHVHPVPLPVLEQVDLAPGQGVMVVRVRPGSAAEAMGLHPGDVIVSLNGTTTDSRRDVRAIVLDQRAGNPVSVTVLRGDPRPITLTGTYDEMPPWMEARARQRLADMTEGWEAAVVERQRAELAARAASLAAAQAVLDEVAAARSGEAVIQRALQGAAVLPPLRFPVPANAPVVDREAPWRFAYAWSFTTPTGDRRCAGPAAWSF